MNQNDAARQTFMEEAREHLAGLENSLLELEENPGDETLISTIFRSMHTIKGSGAMFGFDDISSFTHEIETVFDKVRNKEIPVSKNLINLTLGARDYIRCMLEAREGGEAANSITGTNIITALKKLVAESTGTQGEVREAAGSAPVPREAEAASHEVTYRIRFRPAHDIFSRGINPLYIVDDLASMGHCRVVAQTAAIPYLEDHDPENCYMYWDIILTTSKGLDAVRDVFIFVDEGSEISIDVVDEGGEINDEASYKKIGEILVEKGDLSAEDLGKILSNKKKIGEVLVASGLVSPRCVQAALAEQQHIREARAKRQGAETASSIRVPSEKLDTLVNLVGELVTVHARLNQTALRQENAEMTAIAEDIERLMWDLRETTMNIRMLPIGTTFSRFKRLVRDLSAELGKDIELTAEGAETELDKTVIDQLNDPMVHLIRNSIDHGIELPNERRAAGKAEKGTIHLSAVHSGAHVLITIRDDGAGMDKEVIRAKGVEKELIRPDAVLSEKEIFSLIFAPGFSTAKKVTNVSGRGVGMDVVRRGIEALRGTVEIGSVKGAGTAITIMLPLTLAIIDGFLVRVMDDHFVIPLSAVSECMELTGGDIEEAHGKSIVNVRGSIVPYIRLRERFGMNGKGRPDIEHLVITETGGKRVGFVTDEIIGEHQTVIKNLGRMYNDVEGLSGATILGDGTVALIIDVPKIVSQVEAGSAN